MTKSIADALRDNATLDEDNNLIAKVDGKEYMLKVNPDGDVSYYELCND